MEAMLVGSLLAAGVVVLAKVVGFDRDRSFYPVVLVVVGSYYVLFAVMAGASAHVITELALFGLFTAMAIAGFQWGRWVIAGGLALHGLFDFVRGGFLHGAGVPRWWPEFCGAFDLIAAGLLAALLIAEQRKAGLAREAER